jgi:glycosyltransferase involved in cell wall biosynthesis
MHTPFLQAWFGALVRRVQKIPLVTTFHTHIVEYLGHLLAGYAEEKIKHILAEPTWQIIRYQYNRSDITIAPSKIMRKELEEHGVNKVIDVPNPISPLFFNTNDQHRKKQSHSFRRTFNIPLDAPLLLYVGRVAFEKRLELLLQAYKALKIKYSNLFLAIVGDGPQLNMYKDKAKKLELQDYVFTGYIHQRQLPGVYAAGTIFVSPSDTETQGLTFIEAMSQKTPVIGVNSRGVTDHVRHGKSGLLANSLDSKEFENLIEYVFQHSKETQALIEEAKAVASKYSYAGFNKRLMEAYSLAARNWKLRGMK